eukprot:gene25900-31701_t
MEDPDMVRTLCEVAAIAPEQSRRYLQEAGWNLEGAISIALGLDLEVPSSGGAPRNGNDEVETIVRSSGPSPVEGLEDGAISGNSSVTSSQEHSDALSTPASLGSHHEQLERLYREHCPEKLPRIAAILAKY